MMKSEFDALVGQGFKVSAEDYEVIEVVYTWYDENITKETVAEWFKAFGMKIFRDLALRAVSMRDQDTKIRDLGKQLAAARERQQQLYRGRV